MTLKQLSIELERIERELQSLRRSDFDIPGDFTFAAAMRQHLIISLDDIRSNVDVLISSLDHVDDADRLLTLRERLTAKVRQALTGGENAD